MYVLFLAVRFREGERWSNSLPDLRGLNDEGSIPRSGGALGPRAEFVLTDAEGQCLVRSAWEAFFQ